MFLQMESRFDVSTGYIGTDGDVGVSYMVIYNRVLSTADWQSNYNAIKTRLGLRSSSWDSLP